MLNASCAERVGGKPAGRSSRFGCRFSRRASPRRPIPSCTRARSVSVPIRLAEEHLQDYRLICQDRRSLLQI